MIDMGPSTGGILSRRLRRKEEVRQKIYDAAISLFRQQGYESTTVQEICNLADTARQTFFNYFPTKDHVLAEYHNNLIDSIFAQISQVSAPSHTKAIVSAMRVFAAGAETSVTLSRTILRHVFSSEVLAVTDQKNEEKIFSWFYTRVREAVETGELVSGLDIRLLTTVIMSVLSSAVQEWIVAPERFDLEKEMVRRTRFLLRLCLRCPDSPVPGRKKQ